MTKTSFNRVDFNNINNYSAQLSIPFENNLLKLKFQDTDLQLIVHQFLNCIKVQSLKKGGKQKHF